MTAGAVDVSVLVPVRNEERRLRAAVERMRAQQFDGSIELLLIDGRSTDATPQILSELAAADDRIRVLDNPDRTTPRALNIGLAAARGEFVARMDAHTLYPPSYLATGVGRLRRGGVDQVSGPALAVGDGAGSERVALALSTLMGTGGARFRRGVSDEVEVDTGFTGVWRRSTLERHGGWRDDCVDDEDFELAARIRKGGGRIVCVPTMAASYIPRGTIAALARQYSRYGYARVRTIRRHPESMRRSHALPPAITVAALAALAGRPLARAAIGVYGSALVAASAQAARDNPPARAAALPAVFATMHIAYGLGFLAGCVAFGPPLRAFAAAAGLDRG